MDISEEDSSLDSHLVRFQEYADSGELLLYIRLANFDEESFAAAIDAMQPIFTALTFGEEPYYDASDVLALESRRPEVVLIVQWMLDSPKADMRAAAIRLMGLLGWSEFRPSWEHILNTSSAGWERLAVIQAIDQLQEPWVVESLTNLLNDPDPEIRLAAGRLLSSR